MTNKPPLLLSDETLAISLTNTIARLNDEQLNNFLQFIISELAGYPMPPESEIGNSDEHLCKELVRQLSENETLLVLYYFLSLRLAEKPESRDCTFSLQKFIKYDLSPHLRFLGIKHSEPIPQDFDKNLERINHCLNAYRNALSDLMQASNSAISTLDLIAEAESVLQSGNWATSKGGVSSVFATRLAVECRDRLRQSHQEFKNSQVIPDEF